MNLAEIIDDLMVTPADVAEEPGTTAETVLGAVFIVALVLLFIFM